MMSPANARMNASQSWPLARSPTGSSEEPGVLGAKPEPRHVTLGALGAIENALDLLDRSPHTRLLEQVAGSAKLDDGLPHAKSPSLYSRSFMMSSRVEEDAE